MKVLIQCFKVIDNVLQHESTKHISVPNFAQNFINLKPELETLSSPQKTARLTNSFIISHFKQFAHNAVKLRVHIIAYLCFCMAPSNTVMNKSLRPPPKNADFQ